MFFVLLLYSSFFSYFFFSLCHIICSPWVSIIQVLYVVGRLTVQVTRTFFHNRKDGTYAIFLTVQKCFLMCRCTRTDAHINRQTYIHTYTSTNIRTGVDMYRSI